MSQLFNGSGRYKFSDGEYDGEWKDGKRHGRGKFVYDNGATYEGDFYEDEMHGRGKYVFITGATYEGDYREDAMHGWGKYVFLNGDSYEGDWIQEKAHGRGLQFMAEAGVPVGSHLLCNAGDVYDGGWKDSMRHGECTYTFFNGETFTCTWADGSCPEFTERQRAVQAAPDHESAQARAQGYASVQDKAAADAAEKAKYSHTLQLLELLGLQAHIPTFL